MHLPAERYKTMSPHRSSSDKYAAQSLRRQRADLLGKLREASGAEGLAHRARAIALIGFKLFRQPEPAPDHGARRALTAVKDLEVPEAMRDDLAFVQRALEEGSEGVARLLGEEGDPLAASFRLLNSPQLVLAPVRIRAVEERRHELGGE